MLKQSAETKPATTNSVYVIDGKTDNYTRIPDVGLLPWAVEIIDGNSYCH
ncbi:MAG: hypothetical protein Q6358_08890 [Candidatus Brocadiales bacterium]|nr:hypothetical protein [Candidatus Brocadiales bacterium]